MDLSELKTSEILAELEKRSEIKKDESAILAIGTIGLDGRTNFVEVFKEVRTEKDLDFIRNAKLRSRFNTHRFYQIFYFKTTNFKKLEENLNDNNERFANWVREVESIKFIRI